VAVAGLLVALSLWPRPSTSPSRPDRLAEGNDTTVAILLRAPGAVWEETDLLTHPGAPLPPGRLRLRSGVVQIEFYSGATVVLEGPADFLLVSSTEAFCSRGKLRATVPPQAEGFTIRSPRLDVVDKGTEFGLLVDDRDRTEVHVFRGKVEWSGTDPGGPPPPRQELTTGHGIRVDGTTAARPINPDPAAFVSTHDLARRLQAETQLRKEAWQAASELLCKDPTLELYYTFQDEQPWARTLRDHVGRPAPHHGAIIGCAWAPGRWPGKDALEFRRVSDRVRFHLPGEFRSLTMMAWVRVDALPHRFNSLMMTDGWAPGAPHWHISDAGRIALGVQGASGKGGHNYTTYPVFQPFRFGRWAHLAVVYDGDGDRVLHFVDGEKAAEEATRFDTPLRILDAELGNWDLGPRLNEKRPIRYFNGRIDEFLLFSRALPEQEVHWLWTQGRPPS
jgi:hypothetical protein